MADEIRIAEAAQSDLPAILGLLGELADGMADQDGIDTGAAGENVTELLDAPDWHLLVARDGTDVVGFCNFTVRTTALHAGRSGLIDELVVTEGLRGSGVGRSLVEAVAAKCRRLGCVELEVGTEKANIAAREFYRQCGFQEDAVHLEMPL